MPILHFKGKSVIQNHHHTVKFHELNAVPKKGLSAKPSLDDNLIIHGDNLAALKALLPVYAGKVKCIYIDPPYNTGNEKWVYNDNVNSPMIQKWLKEEVGRDDLARHDKWACMMYPRLKLLWELLADDGVIFISIDNNEVHNLRSLLDEIFGENNFVGYFVWRKKEGGGQTDEFFVTEHEYIIVYRKSEAFEWLDEKIPIEQAAFNKEDEGGKYNAVKLAKWGTGAKKEDRPKMHFPIDAPDGSKVYPIAPDGTDGRWRVGKERMQILIANKLIHWEKKDDKWVAYEKKYFQNGDEKVIKERSIIFDLATTGDGSNELTEIFGEKAIFENPKPSLLIRYLISYATNEDSIVLDSFAGSGTTAHAVLAQNKEDGGKRKFILVELEDYADKITAERVRRVSGGVPNAKDESLKEGLGGAFSYYELGDPIDIDAMLGGKKLPSYNDLAQYTFFTATGEALEPTKVDQKNYYLGSSSAYEVFMMYEPDAKKLRGMALNLELAQAIEERFPGKAKLVFAPACYLEEFDLRERNIRFAQLPFEIYRLAE